MTPASDSGASNSRTSPAGAPPGRPGLPPASRDAAPLARVAREGDYDRYLTTLFVPADRRPALLALIALNLELARIRDAVAEPMIGQIRLQWWREAVEAALAGTPRHHDVLEALSAARGHLRPAVLAAMIDAREVELSAEPLSLAGFEAYAEGTAGALAEAMTAVLADGDGRRGAREDWVPSAAHESVIARAARGDVTAHAARESVIARAARDVGTAFGIVGVLRATRFQADRGRVLLPADVLDESGTSVAAVQRLQAEPGLATAARRLADIARDRLRRGRAAMRDVPRPARAALLVGALTDAYLARLEAANFDLLGADLTLSPLRKQLAVAWAAVRGRF
ncbi:MAG: phytoene/squalene synthase family protein [Gemmatimonas sp.]